MAGVPGVSDEMMNMPGFRRGVELENNHRGATLHNAEYLVARENVQPVELESLKKVFNWLDTKRDQKLCWQEISDALNKLGHKTPREQIELWIWEVDDDLDMMVAWDEFLTMYQRCISDSTGNEPRNLFNLVQFLMYDKTFSGRISVEQTLQILFVRHDRGGLDAEIAEIFGDQQKGPDGQEVKISFTQFLTKANARLTKMRWQRKEVTKVAISTRRK
jgi:Ca2+-binding EF-hand superfamily protein